MLSPWRGKEEKVIGDGLRSFSFIKVACTCLIQRAQPLLFQATRGGEQKTTFQFKIKNIDYLPAPQLESIHWIFEKKFGAKEEARLDILRRISRLCVTFP